MWIGGQCRVMNRAEVYRQKGFVTPIEVFSDDQIAGYRAAFDELEARIGRDKAQIGVMSKERQIRFIWEMATHPNVLEAARSVYGPDIALIGTHVFCKYPTGERSGAAYVAWHQDVTYWGLQPPAALTAWIAIDDADFDNGCMRVIPGSHKHGILEHGKASQAGNLLSINQAIDTDLIDPNQAQDIELEAGMMSLHDGLLVHGSNPNRSDRRRCGLTVRLVTPQVRVVEESDRKSTWQMTLLCGEDRFGYHEFLPPPEF